MESNHNINLYTPYTGKNEQITFVIYWIDRSKTYYYNLWHASIKARWRDATLALWYTAKTTKRLKNKTRKRRKTFFASKRIDSTLLLWQQWTMTIFDLFLFFKK